jgi:predicted metal-dependent hydrolase
MYPDAYIQCLVHFHSDRDYFECHEILEDYWKKTGADKQSIWVGLILLAVSNYHYRRGNVNGAFRTLKKALRIIKNNEHLSEALGMDLAALTETLKTRLVQMETGKTYTSFNLPITDQNLLDTCRNHAKKRGLAWGENSDLGKKSIIHRHALRDRSQVIRERELAMKKRKNKGRESV